MVGVSSGILGDSWRAFHRQPCVVGHRHSLRDRQASVAGACTDDAAAPCRHNGLRSTLYRLCYAAQKFCVRRCCACVGLLIFLFRQLPMNFPEKSKRAKTLPLFLAPHRLRTPPLMWTSKRSAFKCFATSCRGCSPQISLCLPRTSNSVLFPIYKSR